MRHEFWPQYSNTPILHHSGCDISGTFVKRRITFLLIIIPYNIRYAICSLLPVLCAFAFIRLSNPWAIRILPATLLRLPGYLISWRNRATRFIRPAICGVAGFIGGPGSGRVWFGKEVGWSERFLPMPLTYGLPITATTRRRICWVRQLPADWISPMSYSRVFIRPKEGADGPPSPVFI